MIFSDHPLRLKLVKEMLQMSSSLKVWIGIDIFMLEYGLYIRCMYVSTSLCQVTLILYSESKQMTITIANFTTISGHFSPNCMFISYKKEVQTVILRCLMGLNIDWFKNYGLRCKWWPQASLANFQNIATD